MAVGLNELLGCPLIETTQRALTTCKGTIQRAQRYSKYHEARRCNVEGKIQANWQRAARERQVLRSLSKSNGRSRARIRRPNGRN